MEWSEDIPQKNHEQLFRILNREEIREIKIIVLIGKNIKKIKSKIIKQNKKHKFYLINERHDVHKFYSLFDLNSLRQVLVSHFQMF